MSFRSLAHLTGALAANSPARPLDVLRIKSALGALGHYDATEWGVTPFPDGALFAGIEAFQRARGLKVDGRMTPAGETEAALVQVLSKRAGRFPSVATRLKVPSARQWAWAALFWKRPEKKRNETSLPGIIEKIA